MRVNFDSPYKIDDGYGNSGENILLALDKHPDINVFTSSNWKHTNPFGLLPRTIELYGRGFSNKADYSIRFSQPDSFTSAPKANRARIGWSMWEFTNLPKVWNPGINSIDANFVPCKHNRQLWLNAGCKKPVYTVNLGIDPNFFYYIEDGKFRVWPGTKNTDMFTFLIAGTLSSRKNPDMVYRTFERVFGDRKDVRLIIKSSKGLPFKSHPPKDNIIIINESWVRTRYADLMRSADVFVYPTEGEGFGLSPVEAMAVGTTTICTDWSGPAEYLDDEYAYKLNYTLGGSVGSHWGDKFGYAIPDEEHLAELMLYTFEHQDEAREKGRKAAKWISQNLTWTHTANRIHSILKTL